MGSAPDADGDEAEDEEEEEAAEAEADADANADADDAAAGELVTRAFFGDARLLFFVWPVCLTPAASVFTASVGGRRFCPAASSR